jgi:signal transduction histidine kinase
MRERAALLGGAVQIVSAQGQGTTITARFPVRRS